MIYAYAEQNNLGNYVNAQNVRYILHTAAHFYGKHRSCWQMFESLEAAMKYFELTPYYVASASYELE